MTWQMINSPGFRSLITHVPSISFFKGELYVGAPYNYTDSDDRHAVLWKCFPSEFMSPSYIRDHWTIVDLLTDSRTIDCIVSYGDFLFVATEKSDPSTIPGLYRYTERDRYIERPRDSERDRERARDRSRRLVPRFLEDGRLGISDMVAFRRKLYAVNRGRPLRIFRTSNPLDDADWEEVTGDITTGDGPTSDKYGGIFATNGTHLYFGTVGQTPGGGGSVEIWRSDGSGDGSDWDIWISDSFGETGNGAIVSMSFFEGDLYAATQNHVEGSKIFRIDLSVPDSYSVSPTENIAPLRGSAVWRDRLFVGEGNNRSGARLFVKEADGEGPSPFESATADFTGIFLEPGVEPPSTISFQPQYLVPIKTSRHPSVNNIFLAAWYNTPSGTIIWRQAATGTRYVTDWIYNARPVRWLFRNTRIIPRLFGPIWEVIQSFPRRQEPINPPIDRNHRQ